MTWTAAQLALGIFEILEPIINKLHPDDVLYNAQRVSRFWQDVIEGSSLILKTSFLVGESGDILDDNTLHPLLSRWFRNSDCYWTDHGNQVSLDFPLYKHLVAAFKTIVAMIAKHSNTRTTQTHGANWKDAVITRPMAPHLRVLVNTFDNLANARSVIVSRGTGITIRYLLAALIKVYKLVLQYHYRKEHPQKAFSERQQWGYTHMKRIRTMQHVVDSP